MSRLLIVNADDYGLTEAVDRGILLAHRDGVVTSTSVMAGGPSLPRTGTWLTEHAGLDTGAHLTLTGENPPVLSRAEIPTLVGRRGFRHDWRVFLARASLGLVDPADIERECTAQLGVLTRDHGLRLSHLDTHEHVHLWPAVARVVVALAQRNNIAAVRLPTSNARGIKGFGVRRLSRRLAARIQAGGLDTTSAFGGLDESGRLTLRQFLSTVEQLAGTGAATIEINCHPGEADPLTRERHAAWDFHWDAELAALTSPRLRAAIVSHALEIGGHARLRKAVPRNPGDAAHSRRLRL